MKVKDQFARPITNPVPDKPTERAPLLSDEEMNKGVWVKTPWEGGGGFASHFEKDGKTWTANDVRDFYEAKITSGELRVVKTTNTVFGGEFSCQQCHGRLLKSYVCCPYCTAQIIK
jgi:hypothetical protein